MTNHETSIEIGTRLAKAREDAVSAAAGVNTAQAAYADALLTASAPALRKLAEARSDATIRVDQLNALVSKLEVDLDLATEAEAEASRYEQYAAACALAESARKQLFADYPKAAEKIRAVLGAIAEADIAVEAANQNLPAGATPIAKPEGSRALPNLPEEIVSEDTVELWVMDGNSSPLPAEQQDQVDRNGRIAINGRQYNCTRRHFRRREFLPPVFGRYVRQLASEINLPGLAFGEGSYWKPVSGTGEAPRQLAEPRRPPAVDGPRAPVVEYQPVRNP